MATTPKKPAALKPFGSSLADFGKLLPAETELLEAACTGLRSVLNGGKRPDKTLSEIELKNITIRSGFLRFLALGGDAQAPVHANGVQIEGAWLACKDGKLDLQGCALKQDLFAVNCHIDGFVTLIGAKAQTLSFEGSAITGTDNKKCSLLGDGLKTTGNVFLNDGFFAGGTVRLPGAAIDGVLICENGRFNGKIVALHCDRLKTTGDVFLRNGFIAAGMVRLPGAEIGGDLDCCKGRFKRKTDALVCDSLKTTGSVFLRNGFTAAGTVRFPGAEIGGDLDCVKGSFAGASVALACQNAIVHGGLDFREVTAVNGVIDLYRARIGTIVDDPASWQKARGIALDGCTYEAFAGDLSDRASWWKKWLGLQIKDHRTKDFKPQPYEQLAKVLRAMGHETQARNILFEKYKQLRKAVRRNPSLYGAPKEEYDWPWLKWHWSLWMNWCLETFVGYGYKPGRAVFFLFTATILLSPIYQAFALRGVITPSDPLVYLSQTIPADCRENWVKTTSPRGKCAADMPSEYTPFNAFIYALDISLPVIDLGIEKAWAPRSTFPNGTNHFEGWAVRFLLYAHTLTGWILSLLFVSAVSGIIRKD